MIDEAGQATEPETTAVVANLLNPARGQLVLAGDPKQLGPIIHADLAKKLRLDVSFLERLMMRAAYQKMGGVKGAYDPNVLTKLIHNYRSHEAILTVPSTRFYDGELIPCADVMLRNSLVKWEHLPVPGVPLIFHGVAGKENREASSPSWFNSIEIEVRSNGTIAWDNHLLKEQEQEDV